VGFKKSWGGILEGLEGILPPFPALLTRDWEDQAIVWENV
jgi:hypothetical protein